MARVKIEEFDGMIESGEEEAGRKFDTVRARVVEDDTMRCLLLCAALPVKSLCL